MQECFLTTRCIFIQRRGKENAQASKIVSANGQEQKQAVCKCRNVFTHSLYLHTVSGKRKRPLHLKSSVLTGKSKRRQLTAAVRRRV